MLTNLWDFLQRMWNSVVLWVVICPWERGLRVRLGKHVTILQPGISLKLPILDEVYRQTIRLRVCGLGVQLLSTRDGKAIHVAGAIGYAITDLRLLYQTLHHAEDTIRNIASAAIAEFVVAADATPDLPARIEREVASRMNLAQFGLGDVTIQVTDFAIVRTLRIVNDMKWGGAGDTLSTNQPAVGPR